MWDRVSDPVRPAGPQWGSATELTGFCARKGTGAVGAGSGIVSAGSKTRRHVTGRHTNLYGNLSIIPGSVFARSL